MDEISSGITDKTTDAEEGTDNNIERTVSVSLMHNITLIPACHVH